MRSWSRYLLVATFVASLMSSVVAWGQSAGTAASVAAAKPDPAMSAKQIEKVNLNTADETALTALKGIGKVKAKAIVEYRQNNGPFKTVQDLVKVKGIGDKTVESLQDQLAVE